MFCSNFSGYNILEATVRYRKFKLERYFKHLFFNVDSDRNIFDASLNAIALGLNQQHQIMYYSSNEIRKTQNEHHLKPGSYLFGVYITWFLI
jgi:hypothetical protein